jgi:hypothetical protein
MSDCWPSWTTTSQIERLVARQGLNFKAECSILFLVGLPKLGLGFVGHWFSCPLDIFSFLFRWLLFSETYNFSNFGIGT